MITRFKASNFTVFTELDISFSSGVNIFIGKNGTGKTHLMKVLYSACSVMNKKEDRSFAQKLNGVFMPRSIGRLVHRSQGRGSGRVVVYRRNVGETKERSITCDITTLNKTSVSHSLWKEENQAESIFIPVKDMLANAPGFRSLFSQKKLAFEEVYLDILDKAFLPIVRGKQSPERVRLLNILNKAMLGRVIDKDETFYMRNSSGELEFSLLAEGFRKLGLLYRLIQNESLTKGTMLFWDEPEANLNPQLSQTVVQILMELQRMGVQIFIATHDYVLLKEFELATTQEDSVLYHTLYKDDAGVIRHNATNEMGTLFPNAIDETFARILDDEIKKGLEDL